MKHLYSSLVFTIVACAMALPAHATLIGLNSVSPTGTQPTVQNAINPTATAVSSVGCPASFNGVVITPGVNPVIAAGGVIVGDTCNQTVNFGAAGALQGHVTLRELVVQEAVTNTLDFYLQATFTPLPSSSGFGIARVFGVPFPDPSELVGTYTSASLFSSSGTGVPSKIVDGVPQALGGGFGGLNKCLVLTNDCITFDFNSPYSTITKVLVISTNDTLFSPITRGDFGADMGLSGTSNLYGLDTIYGFAPIPSSVPEPMSIVLTGSMLAISALVIRRRRSSKKDLSVS